MILYGKDYSRDALRKHMGSMDQLAGIKLVQFDDGVERSARAALFHTGSGLQFTVFLDRGMDIPSASHQGRAMGWRSTTGDVAPQYFEPEGIRWLRSYFGGLLTTCGLQNVGAPDENSALTGNGLHGRIGNTPARNVQVVQEWQDDEYVLSITGTMRETRLFGENLSLTRRVHTRMGEHRFWIEDLVRNEAFEPSPFMLLYHCNIGWPALGAGSEMVCPSRAYAPRDAEAEDGHESWHQMHGPSHAYSEKVYFHDMEPDAEGMVKVAMLNDGFDAGNGFGVYVRYRKQELPRFTQWKLLGEQAYVVGFEPCNCGVQGRAVDERDGLLRFLQPGEEVRLSLEFGVISDRSEADAIRASCRKQASTKMGSYLDFTELRSEK